MNQLLSKTNCRKLSHFLSAWGAVISMIVAFVIFSILQPSFFFTLNNVENILRAASITVVIAMGTTFAFSCNVFDLSVGALATLGAAFSLTFMVWYGIPLPLAILLTVVCCMAFGAINAILVLKFKIPAILTTLAMQFIMSGLALTYSGGSVINPNRPGANGQEIVMEVPELFWKLGKAPWIYIIMLASEAVVAIFQNYTKHGRFLYAMGGNRQAAKLSGIDVKKYRYLAGMITGLFIAIGGILVASRGSSAQVMCCDNYLMQALAAVFVGRSVGGAEKPNALGTLVGAMLVSTLENGLTICAVPYYILPAVKGAVLALALMAAYAGKKEQ